MVNWRDCIVPIESGAAYQHPVNSLCWCCKNAYGGCSWSGKSKKPVEGWKAVRRDLVFVDFRKNRTTRRTEESYAVLWCPIFLLDPRFRTEHNRFSPERIQRQTLDKLRRREQV